MVKVIIQSYVDVLKTDPRNGVSGRSGGKAFNFTTPRMVADIEPFEKVPALENTPNRFMVRITALVNQAFHPFGISGLVPELSVKGETQISLPSQVMV